MRYRLQVRNLPASSFHELTFDKPFLPVSTHYYTSGNWQLWNNHMFCIAGGMIAARPAFDQVFRHALYSLNPVDIDYTAVRYEAGSYRLAMNGGTSGVNIMVGAIVLVYLEYLPQ